MGANPFTSQDLLNTVAGINQNVQQQVNQRDPFVVRHPLVGRLIGLGLTGPFGLALPELTRSARQRRNQGIAQAGQQQIDRAFNMTDKLRNFQTTEGENQFIRDLIKQGIVAGQVNPDTPLPNGVVGTDLLKFITEGSFNSQAGAQLPGQLADIQKQALERGQGSVGVPSSPMSPQVAKITQQANQSEFSVPQAPVQRQLAGGVQQTDPRTLPLFTSNQALSTLGSGASSVMNSALNSGISSEKAPSEILRNMATAQNSQASANLKGIQAKTENRLREALIKQREQQRISMAELMLRLLGEDALSSGQPVTPEQEANSFLGGQ